MEHELAQAEVTRLRALAGDDPGGAAFPALAEALRRAGRAREAETVARDGLAQRPDAVDGRVALALALLDLGRLAEARDELECVLGDVPDHPLASRVAAEVPPPAPETSELVEIAEGEIEAAFDAAETEPDELVTADRVAEAALRATELEPDDEILDAAEPDLGDELPATRTVAALLERQGHGARADAMRASLDDAESARILATLERWLDNLRRGVA